MFGAFHSLQEYVTWQDRIRTLLLSGVVMYRNFQKFIPVFLEIY